MTTKEIIPNISTIHVAAELIILGGITFYFTKKTNNVLTELNKVKTILQHQNVKLSKYEKTFKDYQDKLNIFETLVFELQERLNKQDAHLDTVNNNINKLQKQTGNITIENNSKNNTNNSEHQTTLSENHDNYDNHDNHDNNFEQEYLKENFNNEIDNPDISNQSFLQSINSMQNGGIELLDYLIIYHQII